MFFTLNYDGTKIMFSIVRAFKHISLTLERLIVIHLVLLVTFKEQECNLYLLVKLFSTMMDGLFSQNAF